MKKISKLLYFFLEILAIIAGLSVLVGGVLVWRLTAGPFDVGFARDYIKQALYDPDTGYEVAMEGVVLEWPDLKGPLLLELKDLSLTQHEKTMLTIGSVRLGLSHAQLMAGRIRPVSIILSQPSLHLVRDVSNGISFGIERPQATEVGEEFSVKDIVDTLLDEPKAGQSPSVLSHLNRLVINEAGAVVEDHVLGITWFLRDVDTALARDEEGLAVTASISVPAQKGLVSKVDMEALYYRNGDGIKAHVDISDFDPRIISKKVDSLSFLNPHSLYFTGSIDLNLNNDLQLMSAAVDLSSRNGTLVIDEIYDEPKTFESLKLAAQYDRISGKATLDDLTVDLYGTTVRIASDITIGDQSVNAPVTLSISELTQDRIKALWPVTLEGKPVTAWLTQRLSQGRIYDITAGLDVSARERDGAWDTQLGDVVADFKLSGMSVDYEAPLWPATETEGSGHFENDILDITIDSAMVQDLDVTGGRVLIDNVTSDEIGTATITLALKGALKSVFSYIANEPIGMNGAELGLDTDGIKGQAALDIDVSFPTIKDLPKEKVKVKVKGTLSDVLLPNVVKTLDLSGGPLAIVVDKGKVDVKGKALLDGRNLDLTWEQYLDSEGKPFSSKITAGLVADKGLRDSLGITLDDWMDGSLPVKVTYTEYQNDKAVADVVADATPVVLKVAPFDHIKPAGAKAKATCQVLFHGGYLQEIQDLEIRTSAMQVNDGRLLFDTQKGEAILRRGQIGKFSLDETDIGIDFEIGARGLLKLTVKGPFLDARPFLGKKGEKKEPYAGPPVIAYVNVGRMRTHETRLLEKTKIFLNLDRNGLPKQLELDAMAGRGDVYLRLKPDVHGKQTLRFEAADAGATLRAFDVYENVVGGKLVIVGEAANTNSNNVIYGNAQLSDFRIKDAPALARLVSAISPTGLPQLLSGEGLFFSRLESKFDWYLRPQGDLYVFTGGRTSGSSLGLTFEGEIDKAKGRMDLKGHVVPVSEVNTLLSNIPIVGQILSGGSDGGVFAATYTAKGAIDEPTISVNPLAALAPGILRRIFFEGGD